MNYDVASEWYRTGDEYVRLLARPFATVSAKTLWRCSQPHWEAALTEWTVLQMWMSTVAIILGQVLLVVGDEQSVVSAVVSMVAYIVISYVYAHLGWFGAVKKHGCCWLGCICLQGPDVLLVWAGLCMLLGIARCADALRMLGGRSCSFCIVNALLQALYAASVIYMGVCCGRMWQKDSQR
eukprot:CAMPEP_0198495370 /NCGR_PEP_ID=MMETSP1462-20131121/5166_1 /TAXON_ID=1333877 /ORGANISM="Brandtodinium nutriculum, Strain RCC3387" /LENGTH=180 /DNA_ID=CAMNT_0044224141 /DNA_START=82 /DNA_END=620 /DNA_ORIENTATION=+